MSMLALVDCNNFFVSCERAVDPGLESRPVVVLSNNDGCVISRSNEAKQLGIEMGVPYFKIKEQLKRQNILAFSANFPLYSAKSLSVAHALAQWSEQAEYYSIDESFLSLQQVPPKLIRTYSQDIQADVMKRTGIPVSIGVAQTKTLAKLANSIAKRNARLNGILNLYQSPHLEMVLSRTPVEKVWGVGHKTAKSLNRSGIFTALELAEKEDAWILKRYNVVLLKTVWELRQKACLPIQVAPPPKRSVMYSRTFGKLLYTRAELETVVANFTARAAEKLREENLAARRLYLSIRTNRHTDASQRYASGQEVSWPTPTHCTHTLIRHALTVLAALFEPGFGYHKALVILSGTVPSGERQLGLFEHSSPARMDALMQTLDRINHRHGSNTLRYAVEGLNEASVWKSRKTALSKAGQLALEQPEIINAFSLPKRPLLGFVHPVHG